MISISKILADNIKFEKTCSQITKITYTKCSHSVIKVVSQIKLITTVSPAALL